MAIAINNSTTYETSVANTSYTFSHTVNTSLDSPLLVIAIAAMRYGPSTESAQFTINSVTYNSVSLTEVIQQNDSSVNRGYQTGIFTLLNPSTGSNTISITGTNTIGAIVVWAATLTGINQITPTGAFVGDITDGPPLDVDITTTALNSFIICMASERGDTDTNYVAATNTTEVADLHANAGNPGDTRVQGAVGTRQTTSTETYSVGFSTTGSRPGDQIVAVEFIESISFVPRILVF